MRILTPTVIWILEKQIQVKMSKVLFYEQINEGISYAAVMGSFLLAQKIKDNYKMSRVTMMKPNNMAHFT
ncbi:hypothetical protein PC116_g15533 [Phytophthora cactorum]|uniref:Uncharacterized protein n=1 Tax=Phytophthora cactorum TaxID=29920 RepID=A0A8T1KL49_9STRA|nr:hypothetical protein PC114_g12595 [Phytophthora cactorum]KAG2935763.1 hypothetical protein PC117_g12321 [Phytophthora cactorum]KAG3014106.1 hypothetical protein PC119_g12267 [Phytophthora cactorum]KAG4236376.1 hypothetical protein PC116_g15533 [Phytophthora cactorum]